MISYSPQGQRHNPDIDCEQSLQTPEPAEEPPKRKVVQLSSFKPTKSNFQVKKNGVSVLSFPDGEVCQSRKKSILTASMLT